MSKSGQHNEWSLHEELVALMDSDPVEFNELRFVARMVVSYFRQPMHEITISAIKDGLRFFPLFLSHERVPLYTIESLVRDAERLLSKAKEIQRQHVSAEPTVNCLMDGSENEPVHSDQYGFEDIHTNHDSAPFRLFQPVERALIARLLSGN